MSLFNLPVTHPEKPVSVHPWNKTIKDIYANRIKTAHNSIKNVVYPEPKKGRVPKKDRIRFTVVGNMVTKEFIYCARLVHGMHKYRWKSFAAPIIRGVVGPEWPNVLKDFKVRLEGPFCVKDCQVIVLSNGKYFGSEKELRAFIESSYIYHLALNYQKESVGEFANFVKSSGRTCAYLHVSIDEKPIGTLIFMLYTDICPITCDNFLRLCKEKKGGYGGTPVHRIVQDGWIQCGGFGLKKTSMDCENYIVPHDKRGVLGMANDGRNVDCSTQFFVLLQPSEWMNKKYVAFGQLIDGEQTLQQIEKVPTFYESPTSTIIFYSAGILDLDCQRIAINKSTNAYIDEHIDDLVSIGELFYQELMERVFLEIEFRALQALEPPEGEGEMIEEVDEDGNIYKRIVSSKFLPRLKATSHVKSIVVMKSHSKVKNKVDDEVNNDFDVEDYDPYEPEEYDYSKVTLSEMKTPEKRPYYLAMTDVPYPDEKDSEYDLKKFLRGDYCLESDLDPKISKTPDHKKSIRERLELMSDVLSSYISGGLKYISDSESDSSSDEIDSDEEKKIKKYLKEWVEKASFTGHTVKEIARKNIPENPLEDTKSQFNDEEIRRMRLAVNEMKSRAKKKISIAQVAPWEVPMQIKRRQTGFVRPEDLAHIEKFRRVTHKENYSESSEEEEEEEEEDEDLLGRTRSKVCIDAPKDAEQTQMQIKRRQTGFVRPDQVATLLKQMEEEQEEEQIQEQNLTRAEVSFMKGVRIAPQGLSTTHDYARTSYRRPTTFQPPVKPDDDDDDNDDDDDHKVRQSVLIRLYDDVKIKSDENMLTLKDYKPMSELIHKRTTLQAISSSNLLHGVLLRRDKNYFQRHSFSNEGISFERLQSNHSAIQQKRVIGQISTDYLKNLDIRRHGKSIRAIEYAKCRPMVTVSQYQQLNRQYKAQKNLTVKDEGTKKSEGLRSPSLSSKSQNKRDKKH